MTSLVHQDCQQQKINSVKVNCGILKLEHIIANHKHKNCIL